MEPESPAYLAVEEVLELHDRIVALVGGMPGIRDRGGLESAVAQPKTNVFGHERFPTLFEKAAAYCYFITRSHPFFDGNKRVGFLACLHFLLNNGLEPMLDNDEMLGLINRMAAGQAEIQELAAVLEEACRR